MTEYYLSESAAFATLCEVSPARKTDTDGWSYSPITGGDIYAIRHMEVQVRRLADDGPEAWELTAASDRRECSEYPDLSDISVKIGYYATEDEAKTAGENVLACNGVFDVIQNQAGLIVGVRNPFPREAVTA